MKEEKTVLTASLNFAKKVAQQAHSLLKHFSITKYVCGKKEEEKSDIFQLEQKSSFFQL